VFARKHVGVRAAAGLVVLALAAFAHDSNACSCAGPEGQLLGPDRVDDAPTNTKVRLELPSHAINARTVLAVRGGAEVAVKSRSMSVGSVDVVELTPSSALAPGTQYVVSIVDDSRHPPVRVLGTFKTASAEDKTAPKIDSIGRVYTTRDGTNVRTSCSVGTPWITVESIKASDPGRPNAQLFYGVWVGDASGKIDDTKPPSAILRPYQDRLTIGRSSVCDPHDVTLPKTPFAWIGIAALDEAGNASPVRKMKVDLKAGTP